MNKVISFALWGDDPSYYIGAKENVKMQKFYFPDYVCRFYIDAGMTAVKKIKDELEFLGAEVVLVTAAERSKRLWRLRVAIDPTVDRFLIRDCDSRIGRRECQAVREWEQSGKPVHLMHDHRRHTAPIMGGMWGANKGFMPDFQKKYDSWVDRLDSGWTPKVRIGRSALGDQYFLKKHVFFAIKDNCVSHAAHVKVTSHDLKFSHNLEKKVNFVGQIFDKNNKPVVKP